MDTGIIVLIVVVVLIVIAVLALLPRLRAAQEHKRVQSQRKEVAGRHHAEADQKLAHAEEIERRAEADRAEVELAERQAEARRAEVEMAERKAEAARAEANVSRSAADRTERGLADHEIGLGDNHDEAQREPRAAPVHEERVVREERVVDGTDSGGSVAPGELRDDPDGRRDRPV
jgi:hypothetical protein